MVVPPELAASYAACERLARAHYENFPVASLLLPARMRPHVAALYAFARTADDIADEGDLPPDAREARLTELGAMLVTREWGQPRVHFRQGAEIEAASENVMGSDPIHAVRHTIAACQLPVQLFHDLLSAFRQDLHVTRYESWAALLDYCSRSANPVGRLVLRIAGLDDAQLDRQSDCVCTALQLTNFWQDLERDWKKGRLYVPREILDATGARQQDLAARVMTPQWRAALGRAAGLTRTLFDQGRGIADRVRGRLGWELRLTWLGGVRILDRLERRGFDVFDRRPALSLADLPPLAWRAIVWNR
ncbi:MAG TPA: squalene synthase HpnC [Vicinamibacterales bacterium]|nr:squalene synthase HpnC [Vicinamibacterales bacterium]